MFATLFSGGQKCVGPGKRINKADQASLLLLELAPYTHLIFKISSATQREKRLREREVK
jgi:hypothetical protein